MNWRVLVEMKDGSRRTADVHASNKADAEYRACYKIECEPRQGVDFMANLTSHCVRTLKMN